MAALLLLWPALVLGQDYERWYTVEMAGQAAGYMHSIRKTEGDQITSSSRTVISVARGTVSVSITMEGQFIETVNGNPVSMKKMQQLGLMPSRTEYIFGDDQLTVRNTQADQVIESTRGLPEGKWLTPAAAETFLRKRLAAGADSVVMRTMDPLSGPEPTVINRTGITSTTLDIMGRTLDVYRCHAESSATPGIASTEYLDRSGIPVKLTTNMGGLPVVVVMSDRERALAATGGAELGPELMHSTFIRPDRRIRNPRSVTSATFILSMQDEALPVLPEAGVQRVEELDASRIRVVVDMARSVPASPACIDNQAYLESSPMLNADDPEIRRLTLEALEEASENAAERAEALREFVYRYIDSKELDVGFASASEVARSRQGDCTEHGVLLAAMLRADGIPARVVSGLIYADRFAGERHIFGYHMWTQALLEVDGEHRWVDLDSTLPRPFDATHIALAISALGDGEMSGSLSAIAPLLGRLEVKIEQYE